MGKRKCSAKDCPSAETRKEDMGVTFHRLPSNPISRQNWLKLCHIEEDEKVRYVCSRHFLKADFGNYKYKFALKPKAAPSIFAWTKKPAPVEKSEPEPTNSKVLSDNETSVNPNKRVRKKKINPDFVTDADFRRNKESVDSDATCSKSTDEDTAQSEDSSSGDLPPVLEPETASPSEMHGEVGQIPSLEPSTPSQPPKTKKKSKKTKTMSSEDAPVAKKKQKLVSKDMLPSTVKPLLSGQGQSIIKDRIIVKDKCSPVQSSAEGKQESTTKSKDTNESKEANATSSTSSETQSTTNKQKNRPADTSNTQLTTFEPNTRIEALDINQKWSPATIVEVDYEENEVLVHFDSYSNKYDEWIGISSSSIRVPSTDEQVKQDGVDEPEPKESEPEVSYKAGERCMAYWGDKKFPATVKEVINQETYVVKFDDGYVQKLRANRMTKSSSLFLPIKSSKQERRNKKRKLNVQALFNKRIKTKNNASFDAAPATDEGSSADETPVKGENIGFFDRETIWYPDFENGVPVGTPSQLKSKIGIRDSVIVPDPNLPEKWEKHVLQRERGKFFSVIVTPEDKKLRCPADIQRYIQDHPDFNYQDYRLDFNVIPRNQPRNRDRVQSQERKSLDHSDCDNSPQPPKGDSFKILKVDGVFQCPIEGCGKSYRRENLVQMHVKHYHPEYTKFLDSTPNVLDLVYQRLHGEEFEHSPPSRSYDYYKRGSFTPIDELGDAHESEYQKDSEIKKLLNSTPIDVLGSDSGSQGSGMGTSGEVMETGPDLKALVVTTKSGLKTIPPVKKEIRVEEEDLSEADATMHDQHVPLPTLPGLMDHIIGEDGKVIKIEQMRKEEIIHCTCGITEEDGLMIQCEICMCWQHAHCNNIYRETEVPDKYVCFTCLNPHGQRSSMKYRHDQDWLKLGRLPTGSYHARDEDVLRKRFEDLKSSHDISGGLLELKDYMHTLKQKIKIAETKNHPKLYLWSKPWEKGCLPEKKPKPEDIKPEVVPKDETPEEENKCEQSSAPQPEAPIETADCRLNLLEHILHCQSLIGERLTDFSKQMDELEASESMDEEEDKRIRLTTSMLVRDLGKLKDLSHMI
ncbi:PHD finger protein 20 [Atheta coriaria]|uniref:PHD finger protein 20 n=1 Tax=Dalotia coriaria TaxID=877792 RepID=UPI0031F40471